MTTRSTFFRALTVPERGAAGGFACDIEKNSTLMDGWLRGGDAAFYADRGGRIVRTNGTIPQKVGKVALLPTNIQEICIKYKISLMLCYNEVNSFHVN